MPARRPRQRDEPRPVRPAAALCRPGTRDLSDVHRSCTGPGPATTPVTAYQWHPRQTRYRHRTRPTATTVAPRSPPSSSRLGSSGSSGPFLRRPTRRSRATRARTDLHSPGQRVLRRRTNAANSAVRNAASARGSRIPRGQDLTHGFRILTSPEPLPLAVGALCLGPRRARSSGATPKNTRTSRSHDPGGHTRIIGARSGPSGTYLPTPLQRLHQWSHRLEQRSPHA